MAWKKKRNDAIQLNKEKNTNKIWPPVSENIYKRKNIKFNHYTISL